MPDDWAAEFGQRLTTVGGHVYSVNDAVTARLQLRDILETRRQNGHEMETAVITNHAILRQLEPDTLLPRLGMKTFHMSQDTFRVQDTDLGLTGVD